MTDSRLQNVNDSFVQPFLQPDFDPAEYLNSTLPTPSFSSAASKPATRTGALVDLSTQLQDLMTQLNTHTTRLSSTLTQLTDEIVRSGSRLAYEVEVLRGETLGLNDALNNDLKLDMDLLSAPTPVAQPAEPQDPKELTSQAEASLATAEPAAAAAAAAAVTETSPAAPAHDSASSKRDPEFLARLRTLTTVRERLDAVIKVFGAAMAWPIAPSELSLASSFISVSAPEGTGDADDSAEGREARARAYAEDLRREVAELLASGGQDGVEAATAKVDDLRVVAGVWKGTSEEKARMKLVDSLQKLVDDRVRALGRAHAGETRRQGTATPTRGIDYRYGGMDSSRLPGEGIGGYGFLQNLRNLKNDVYLD